jgi:hypothetical protein
MTRSGWSRISKVQDALLPGLPDYIVGFRTAKPDLGLHPQLTGTIFPEQTPVSDVPAHHLHAPMPLETMTPEEGSARAKKASIAAAKKRTAERLAREAKGRARKGA